MLDDKTKDQPIIATFGTPEFQRSKHGTPRVAIPVTFAEAVIAPSKTVFQLSLVDPLTHEDIEDYSLPGEGKDYQLLFVLKNDVKGSLLIQADGYVLKAETSDWHPVETKTFKLTIDTHRDVVRGEIME